MIYLTNADVDDLAEGHSINVPACSCGREVILRGEDFDARAIANLRVGRTAVVGGEKYRLDWATEATVLGPPSKRVRDALASILEYNWASEETDYEHAIEQGDIEPPGSGHVFEALRVVRSYLDGKETEMDRFSLSIDLGNEAMQSALDVAGALYRVGSAVAAASSERALDASELYDGAEATSGPVFDMNGNRVGEWRFE